MILENRKRLGQGVIAAGILAALLPLGLLIDGILRVAPYAQEPTSGIDLSYGLHHSFC